MSSPKKCLINKATGLPNPSGIITDFTKHQAERAMECGRPAEYKVIPGAQEMASFGKHQMFGSPAEMPVIAYVCEEHAGKVREASNVDVLPL